MSILPEKMHITLGPISWLKCGRVWSLDFFNRWGLFGIGFEFIGYRLIRDDDAA